MKAAWLLSAAIAGSVSAGCLSPHHTGIKASDYHDLAQEIAAIQEEYLSAVRPNSRLHISASTETQRELQRRIELIMHTWGDYRKGIADAESEIGAGRLKLLGVAPLNQIEEDYVRVLSSEYRIMFERANSVLTDSSRIVYVYGFNKRMAREIVVRHGNRAFMRHIAMAAKKYMSKEGTTFSYRNEFFVPWRFSQGTGNIRIISIKSQPVPGTKGGVIAVSPEHPLVGAEQK